MKIQTTKIFSIVDNAINQFDIVADKKSANIPRYRRKAPVVRVRHTTSL